MEPHSEEASGFDGEVAAITTADKPIRCDESGTVVSGMKQPL